MNNDVKFLGGVEVAENFSAEEITAPLIKATNIQATKLQANEILINQGSVAAAIDSLNTNKANKATTLEGYGITNSYTNTQIDKFLENKADKATTLKGYKIEDAYDKTEIDTKLKDKANSATTLEGYGIEDAYPKSTVNGLVAQTEEECKRYTDTIAQDLGEQGFTAIQSDWNASPYVDGGRTNYAYIKNKPVTRYLHSISIRENYRTGNGTGYLVGMMQCVLDISNPVTTLQQLLDDVEYSYQEAVSLPMSGSHWAYLSGEHAAEYGGIYRIDLGNTATIYTYTNTDIQEIESLYQLTDNCIVLDTVTPFMQPM